MTDQKPVASNQERWRRYGAYWDRKVKPQQQKLGKEPSPYTLKRLQEDTDEIIEEFNEEVAEEVTEEVEWPELASPLLIRKGEMIPCRLQKMSQQGNQTGRLESAVTQSIERGKERE